MNDSLDNFVERAAAELLGRDAVGRRIAELKPQIEALQKELLELQYKRDFERPKYWDELGEMIGAKMKEMEAQP